MRHETKADEYIWNLINRAESQTETLEEEAERQRQEANDLPLEDN